MPSQNTGRHRAPSPLRSSAISRSVAPAGKASAVIVASGAMVASLALPASAATRSATVQARATAPISLAVPVAAPSAAQAPMARQRFGTIGFTGVIKPKPVAPVVSARATAIPVGRSATRPQLPVPATAPRSGSLLGIAASLAGIYYVYGGTTTAGFDCSGYTQYVFAKVGISLPRTTEEQRKATTPVTNPQPGDLVFFGSPAHHVGIYAGNGMMWDSEQTGVPVMQHTDRSERGGSPVYGRVSGL